MSDEQEVKAPGAGEQADKVETGDPVDQLGALAAERDQLAAEKANLQDLLLRRQADFDNYRRRAERERLESRENGRMDAILEILPVVDDFERALKSESADKEYAKGVEMIYLRMQDILKGLGLEAIVTTGQKFDPNLHHAVDRAETADAEDETILAEYQKGYLLRGKLLRPSMVKVAVNISARDAMPTAQSQEIH